MSVLIRARGQDALELQAFIGTTFGEECKQSTSFLCPRFSGFLCFFFFFPSTVGVLLKFVDLFSLFSFFFLFHSNTQTGNGSLLGCRHTAVTEC